MKLHTPQKQIGAFVFFLGLKVAQCMELGPLATSVRDVSEGKSAASSAMSKSWESATQEEMGLRPAQGRSSLGRLDTIPEEHPDVDTQFASARERLEKLEKAIPQPTQHVVDHEDQMSLHDTLALRLRNNAVKLQSLQMEISEASHQPSQEENLELSRRLKTILDDIPYHNDYSEKGKLMSEESKALRNQGRQLESQVFETLDFMQEKNLISGHSLSQFFSEHGVPERFAGHLMKFNQWQHGVFPKDLNQFGASKTLQEQIPDLFVIDSKTRSTPFSRLFTGYMKLGT